MSTVADPPATPPDELLTQADLARQFRVSIPTVRAWMRLGRLPRPIRLGKRPYWTRQTIAEFLRSGGSGSASQEAGAC